MVRPCFYWVQVSHGEYKQVTETWRRLRKSGSMAATTAAIISILAFATHTMGNQTTIGRWCDRPLPNLPEYNRTMAIFVANDNRGEQRLGGIRLEEALSEIARLRQQLNLARKRLAEAREELQLRRGVTVRGETGTAGFVDRALYEAAETRVMQLAVENTRLRDRLADLEFASPAKTESNTLRRRVVLRSKFNDGSSSVHELHEAAGGIYVKIGSHTGDKYRIVPNTGDLQLLDDDGLIRMATRLENSSQINECR